MVKVELQAQGRTSSLRELAGDAIRATSGNARAAAIDLNIHEGHLSRQLKDGSLRLEQLEVLGPTLLAELGRQLQHAYGPLAASPAQHAEAVIDQMQAQLNELRQFVRGVA